MVFFPKRWFAFYKLRVDRDAGHGTDLYALRFVKVPNAFGAFVGVDLVDVLAHINGLVWAFGFAHIAVDAFVGDQQCHMCFKRPLSWRCSVRPTRRT